MEFKIQKLNSNPFFSIIIATYNRADLVERALNSLIRQTEKDWEAIIVDDGSTDETNSRIQPYLEKYSNIRYILGEHQGMAKTKNTGIRSAAGKYITFLDSDDEYDPQHLESRKAVLGKHPDVQFLHGGVSIIGSEYVPDRFNPSVMIHLNDCAIGGTFIIERGSAIQLGGFGDYDLEADGDLFDRVKNANLTIMKVNMPTYIYHHETENSMTNSFSGHPASSLD